MSCDDHLFDKYTQLDITCYDCGELLSSQIIDSSKHFHGNDWNDEDCVKVSFNMKSISTPGW